MDKANNTNALAILNNSIENGIIAVFRENERTGGMSCIFKKGNGNEYFYADKSYIPYSGWETMVFPYDFEKQKVSDWEELYVDRIGKSLEDCVEEFAGCRIVKSEYI